ncbi:hypothetical protein D9M73_205980 [compost metagenome]
MITAMAIISPLAPLGKKPPCCHRLATLASGPPVPVASNQVPKAIMLTIAATLIKANQNSISPKTLTWVRLIRLMITKNTAADAQVGKPGHQYWM